MIHSSLQSFISRTRALYLMAQTPACKLKLADSSPSNRSTHEVALSLNMALAQHGFSSFAQHGFTLIQISGGANNSVTETCMNVIKTRYLNTKS